LRILLTGRDGQVGSKLQFALAPLGEVTALARADLDLQDVARIREVVRSAKPDAIVNAAAYTAVDRAESERELAHSVNATAVGVLAQEAWRLGALLVHYSTDYVFDGSKGSPYTETDPTCPINAYGESKLAGEKAIRSSGCRFLILRTSWVYAERGQNFLLAILRKARSARELRVVSDQIGAPTSAGLVARATAVAVARTVAVPELAGLYHVTARGDTSWHGFAQAIVSAAGIDADVIPIQSSEYPSAARRPAYSVLDSTRFAQVFGFDLPGWSADLGDVLRHLPLYIRSVPSNLQD
jgi:dTDP-4-dehydrorhamnose reductase